MLLLGLLSLLLCVLLCMALTGLTLLVARVTQVLLQTRDRVEQLENGGKL